MLYAGGDLNLASSNNTKLASSPKSNTSYVEETNAKDVCLLRRAAHNVLYVLANSNATANRKFA